MDTEKREQNLTDYNVTALRKSIAVLKVLTESENSLGVSEISRLSGINKNMAFRILETLVDLKWVHKSSNDLKYYITLVPFQLFSQTYLRANLLELATPFLKELNKELEETVYLSVLHNDKVLNIQVRILGSIVFLKILLSIFFL